MAKQKVTTEGEEQVIPVIEENITQAPVEPSVTTPVKKTKEKEPEPSEYTLNILRAFPAYASMYIDHQGGTYTPGTPERIRGNAVLYKNPYHKP
uniref:hypothetical protein n=1 Tax=Bacteroides fragilis TaxID=817 RepID=UPI0035635399